MSDAEFFLRLHPVVQVAMIAAIVGLIGWIWHCVTR